MNDCCDGESALNCLDLTGEVPNFCVLTKIPSGFVVEWFRDDKNSAWNSVFVDDFTEAIEVLRGQFNENVG